MFNSATTASRILPNNKVYRQLFDSQAQLSDVYNRVRNNQLSQSVNITSPPDSVPLVRNIRPHEVQKRQWLGSMSYSNEPNINPVTLLFRDERKRRQTEQQRELDELKREVFNLPDHVEHIEEENNTDGTNKGNITERITSHRQTQFNQLWTEFLNKISDINHNLLLELEKIARQCNTYYDQGDQETDSQVQKLFQENEITSLTIKSFENAFHKLEQLLPPRLSKIQEYCQSIEELELERIHKIRDLFKYYSERLYGTHHLSDKETALRLEKQANELNTQILDNRRIYAELEARLLAGETVRIHQYQDKLISHRNKWSDASWIIYKQTWISKLSQCKAKLLPTILSKCQSISEDITTQTHMFIEHINALNSFIPPVSTRENAEQWYHQGYNLVHMIVNKRQTLVYMINEIIAEEIDLLNREATTIRNKVLQTHVYNEEQARIVFERDIIPLTEERKDILKESITDRIEIVYEQLTHAMYDILERLFAFIQPAVDQWDDHQIRLEHITAKLIDMMREARRPYDLESEKKLAKLDSTLDEMRSSSNGTGLAAFLKSAQSQLNKIKASYATFYNMEHSIVNQYSTMIAEEVERYKNEMLGYFQARQVDPNTIDDEPSVAHQYHTTSLSQTTYELNNHMNSQLNLPQQDNVNHDDDDDDNDAHSRDDTDEQEQAFLTEAPTSTDETINVPFYEAFQIPSNLADCVMFNLRRAFLDYYDQWEEETAQRADAVMFSKHDELDKEMDLQMHLHEPRCARIETDIYHVRIAELATHNERIERHMLGITDKLNETNVDYDQMLNEFSKTIDTFKDNVFSLEHIFVNATTTARLVLLQDRLKKQRDTFMNSIRVTLRKFRERFEKIMQHLRQANANFRTSLKTFSEGGNFSLDEIKIYRKKLETTAAQIDRAENTVMKEMEKIEKKQLEQANKIMTQFCERFKYHMIDLQFIELTNRWISEGQVQIKSEVANNNQQAHVLKTLVLLYQTKVDSILNPNLDKPPSTLNEVRELFHQIVLATYERALYLKCLQNELTIPASMISTLREKGLITEEGLVNDLHHTAGVEEGHRSRRASKASVGMSSTHNEETKSVKFASTSPTPSRRKLGLSVSFSGHHHNKQQEDLNTFSTIKSLLHSKNVESDSDEIVEPAASTLVEDFPIGGIDESSTDEATAAGRQGGFGRAKSRDDIYALYCTFGEKKHLGQDFLSKIWNVLRHTTEGLLSHAEVYYKDKGSRHVTRPQALREKFDDFADLMVEKLKNYEEQCLAHHAYSINEFRAILELFERSSSLMAKIELNEQIHQGEKSLFDLEQQFDTILNSKLNESNEEKQQIFETLRPALGQPGKKSDLQILNDRERVREDDVEKTINELRTNTINGIQTTARVTIEALAASAERLVILFDEILIADEITQTRLPKAKQSLLELIRRQQSGRPLEDVISVPLIERKQGHWAGLPLLDDQFSRRRKSITIKKRTSASSQRQKTSASIVTQKTTLPQIQTISQRDEGYQKYKEKLTRVLTNIEGKCSSTIAELNRYRSYWNSSLAKLQQLRTN